MGSSEGNKTHDELIKEAKERAQKIIAGTVEMPYIFTPLDDMQIIDFWDGDMPVYRPKGLPPRPKRFAIWELPESPEESSR